MGVLSTQCGALTPCCRWDVRLGPAEEGKRRLPTGAKRTGKQGRITTTSARSFNRGVDLTRLRPCRTAISRLRGARCWALKPVLEKQTPDPWQQKRSIPARDQRRNATTVCLAERAFTSLRPSSTTKSRAEYKPQEERQGSGAVFNHPRKKNAWTTRSRLIKSPDDKNSLTPRKARGTRRGPRC